MIEEILKSACTRYRIKYTSSRKKSDAKKAWQIQTDKFNKQFGKLNLLKK